MLLAKVTAKGQITIPKEIREQLGLHPGEDLGFEKRNGAFFIKKAASKSPFDKWVGVLNRNKCKKSDEIIVELRGK